jgi:hypothetical protein
MLSYSIEYNGGTYVFSDVTQDESGNSIFEIVSTPETWTDELEEQMVLCFSNVTALPGPFFLAEVGLAGRAGGVKFNSTFGDIESAMKFCLSNLWNHFFASDGRYNGIDALR